VIRCIDVNVRYLLLIYVCSICDLRHKTYCFSSEGDLNRRPFTLSLECCTHKTRCNQILICNIIIYILYVLYVWAPVLRQFCRLRTGILRFGPKSTFSFLLIVWSFTWHLIHDMGPILLIARRHNICSQVRPGARTLTLRVPTLRWLRSYRMSYPNIHPCKYMHGTYIYVPCNNISD